MKGGYEGVDRANAGRVLGLICSLSALLSLVFLPLDPPTDPIEGAGWALAAALIAAGFVAGRLLRMRQPPPSFSTLLAVSYLGLAAIAALQWLGGDAGSPYGNLILLWLGSVMGIHPLQRVLPFLLAATVATGAPLAYGDSTDAAAKEVVGNYLLWVSLSLVLLGLMRYVRSQRLRLREEEREAQELARADTLTGLPNRRAFDEALEAELARSSRAASTTSVALLDLDRFKEINDRHGHLDGDRCLRDVGAAITRALRAGDRAFRWGGDEFGLILPDTDFDGAEEAAVRIASEVINTCAAADGTPISLSWGIAEADESMDVGELLGRADLALMSLKHEKRQA